VPECLAAHVARPAACRIPDALPAVNAAGIASEIQAVSAAGGSYIDTRPWFCSAGTCDTLVENMLVYRDDNHITSTYAKWLTPVVQADLAVATDGVVPSPPPGTATGTGPGTAPGSGSNGVVASGRS
jgi:hypothetical protein